MKRPKGVQLMEEVGRRYEAAALCRSPDTGRSALDDCADPGANWTTEVSISGTRNGGLKRGPAE